MMLKLNLQYFGHLMRSVDSLEKTLMLGGTGGRRRRGQQRMKWLDGCWVWVNSGSWWWTGRPGVLRFMGSQRVGHDLVTELNWTWTNVHEQLFMCYWPLVYLLWRILSSNSYAFFAYVVEYLYFYCWTVTVFKSHYET